MAIEQDSATEAVEQKAKLILDRVVIGAMRLVEPLLELFWRNGAPPEIAVLLSPRRDNTEAATGASRHSPAPRSFDHRGINLVLGPVAIDCGARRSSDDRPASALQRSPHQAIHQRIFERCQRLLAGACHIDQPVGIVAARVRHGQQHQQVATRLVDDWGGEWVHDEKVKFRASLGLVLGHCNA